MFASCCWSENHFSTELWETQQQWRNYAYQYEHAIAKYQASVAVIGQRAAEQVGDSFNKAVRQWQEVQRDWGKQFWGLRRRRWTEPDLDSFQDSWKKKKSMLAAVFPLTSGEKKVQNQTAAEASERNDRRDSLHMSVIGNSSEELQTQREFFSLPLFTWTISQPLVSNTEHV